MSSNADFLKLFPAATLPLHLGETSYRDFEGSGKLIPDEHVIEFVAPFEPDLDEFTELLTVARLPVKDFAAVIYWKAGLLHNHYRLATYDLKGNPVDNRVLAGSYLDEEGIVHSVATVTEEMQVYVVSGREQLGARLGSADDSSALVLGFDDAGLIRVIGQEIDEEAA